MGVKNVDAAVAALKKRAELLRAQIANVEVLKAELAKVERMIAAAEGQ